MDAVLDNQSRAFVGSVFFDYGVCQAYEKEVQKFRNHAIEYKKIAIDLQGEVFDLKKELVKLHNDQADFLRRITDLEKKNAELGRHFEKVRRLSRELEDKNVTLEEKNVALEAKLTSDRVEADTRLSVVQGRLTRMEVEMDDHVGEAFYDQFLVALSGMLDAHPNLDYSFLPQLYQDIIQEWLSEGFSASNGEIAVIAGPSHTIEAKVVIALFAPKIALETEITETVIRDVVVKPFVLLESAVLVSIDMVEFIEEEPVA